MSAPTASRAFRYLATLSALSFFALGAAWLLAPAAMLANWGVASTAKRLACSADAPHRCMQPSASCCCWCERRHRRQGAVP